MTLQFCWEGDRYIFFSKYRFYQVLLCSGKCSALAQPKKQQKLHFVTSQWRHWWKHDVFFYISGFDDCSWIFWLLVEPEKLIFWPHMRLSRKFTVCLQLELIWPLNDKASCWIWFIGLKDYTLPCNDPPHRLIHLMSRFALRCSCIYCLLLRKMSDCPFFLWPVELIVGFLDLVECADNDMVPQITTLTTVGCRNWWCIILARVKTSSSCYWAI